MSHSQKEQTFKGKPISQLTRSEKNQYRRYLQKQVKKSVQMRQSKEVIK